VGSLSAPAWAFALSRIARGPVAGWESAVAAKHGSADLSLVRLQCAFRARVSTPPGSGWAIRKQKLTQEAFALCYGFTVDAVRDWEQGRYQPDQTSRAYLLVIEREPEAVQRALEAAA